MGNCVSQRLTEPNGTSHCCQPSSAQLPFPGAMGKQHPGEIFTQGQRVIMDEGNLTAFCSFFSTFWVSSAYSLPSAQNPGYRYACTAAACPAALRISPS